MQQQLITKMFSLRPTDFKIAEQSISKPSENKLLKVNYPAYQVVEDRIVPTVININATQTNRVVKVNMEFKSVEFNREMTFPFDMPAGYSEFKL
jgi:hypothetical protein